MKYVQNDDRICITCIKILWIDTADATDAAKEIETTDHLTEQEKFWVSIGWTKSDSRPSAIATGAVVGIVFCVLPLLLVFILGLPTLYRDFLRAMYNLTGNEKYNPDKKTEKLQPEKKREPDGIHRHYGRWCHRSWSMAGYLWDPITTPASIIGGRITHGDSMNRQKKAFQKKWSCWQSYRYRELYLKYRWTILSLL